MRYWYGFFILLTFCIFGLVKVAANNELSPLEKRLLAIEKRLDRVEKQVKVIQSLESAQDNLNASQTGLNKELGKFNTDVSKLLEHIASTQLLEAGKIAELWNRSEGGSKAKVGDIVTCRDLGTCYPETQPEVTCNGISCWYYDQKGELKRRVIIKVED